MSQPVPPPKPPAKRGRPLSNVSLDPQVNRRRELDRARGLAYSQRKRATIAKIAATRIAAQERQIERIIRYPTLTDQAEPTPTQLGLRIQDLSIQDENANVPTLAESHALPDPDPHTPTAGAPRRNQNQYIDFFRPAAPRDPLLTQDVDVYGPTHLNVARTYEHLNTPNFSTLTSGTSRIPHQDTFSTTISAPSPIREDQEEQGQGQEQEQEQGQEQGQEEEEVEDEEEAIDQILHYISDGVEPYGVNNQGDVILYPNADIGSVSEGDRLDLPSVVIQQGPPLSQHEIPDSEDEEEWYPTVPTPPSHSSEEDIDDPHQHVVDKLYKQLHQEGHHGCSLESHAEKHATHLQEVIVHQPLVATAPDHRMVSALSQLELLSTQDIDRHSATTAPWLLNQAFCGIESGSNHPKHICLHEEQSIAVEPQTAFDIDSYLGFAQSLAFARKGLLYQPIPLAAQNISSSIHVTTPVNSTNDEGEIRQISFELSDIPHFQFGRLEGTHDVRVYILFPNIASQTTLLSQEQHQIWIDKIFHPIVYDLAGAHVNQHLPASFKHAYADSRARQIETRLTSSQGYATQQAIVYFLQHDILDQLWQRIVQRTQEPSFQQFRDCQIYFSSKNTKLQFKSSVNRHSLHDVMVHFSTFAHNIFDLEHVIKDRFYVDIGKEVCASVSQLKDQPLTRDQQAQVYLWRKCCLKSYLEWIYDGEVPKSQQTFYNVSMLRDACNLTSQTPPSSRLRAGGLVYSQFYGSVKEIADAAKVYPFNNDGLEELALDPTIRKGANRIAGGRRRDLEVIRKAYMASKHRLMVGMKDSVKKSFGVREEHRVTWPVYEALIDRLEEPEVSPQPPLLVDAPSSVWPITTASYVQFILNNADKFATGFEIVHARCDSNLYSWEETKIMAMFLRCLRFSVAAHHLPRESALWWNYRERTVNNDHDQPVTRRWYGLGFQDTITRYGYAWLKPRVDWSTLRFREQYTDHVLFGNDVLKTQYLRNTGKVRALVDLGRLIEMTVGWMKQYQDKPEITYRLVSYLAHVCLQQFRRDTLKSLKYIKPEVSEEAFGAQESFTYAYLCDIQDEDDLHLVSGNRGRDKYAPEAVFASLFTDQQIKRPGWEDIPFRTLYKLTKRQLERSFTDTSFKSSFRRQLGRYLFAYHWVLPYVAMDGFNNYTKAKDGIPPRRMWISMQPSSEFDAVSEDLHKLRPQEWVCTQKKWKEDPPCPLPEYLFWHKERWEQWLTSQPT